MIGLLFLASVAAMTYIVNRDERSQIASGALPPEDSSAGFRVEVQASADLTALNRALCQWEGAPVTEGTSAHPSQVNVSRG